MLQFHPDHPEATGQPWPSRRVWSMLAAALTCVRDDDAAARQALVFGLVGEGVGVEFLTWCQQADLPDPLAVLDDPSLAPEVREDALLGMATLRYTQSNSVATKPNG